MYILNNNQCDNCIRTASMFPAYYSHPSYHSGRYSPYVSTISTAGIKLLSVNTGVSTKLPLR